MINQLIGALLVLGVAYGLVEAWPLIAGPSLDLATPVNGQVVPGGILEVEGKAARVASLSLDGTPLVYDQTGTFSSTLTFPRGGSILTLEATDRFGRKVSVTRSIFVPY